MSTARRITGHLVVEERKDGPRVWVAKYMRTEGHTDAQGPGTGLGETGSHSSGPRSARIGAVAVGRRA
jgi:hypothetical protein